MDSRELERIKEILPDFDLLPDLLPANKAAELTGLKPQTLAVGRCTRRLDIGYIRCGRNIRYPKLEIGRWLLRNSVDFRSNTTEGRRGGKENRTDWAAPSTGR
jgi:hypothetical protein